MDTTAIRKWLENPPGSPTSAARDALLKEIKLQAVRAMATEQLHSTLNDKEWAKMALKPEWQLLQASPRHMEADLAMKRDTHIFKILATGPLQRANDYMAQTIKNRAKATKDNLKRKAK